ncbi:MAG: hypothetical protein AB4042_12525 [Leptolyngbyaceae cyanobacterium]
MIRWQRFVMNGTIWLAAELVLGFMGLDQLADYGEFLQVRDETLPKPSIMIVL